MKNGFVASLVILSISFFSFLVLVGDDTKIHSSFEIKKLEGNLVEEKTKDGEKTISIYTLKCEKNVNFFLGWSGDPDVEKVKLKDYVGKSIIVTAEGSFKSGTFVDKKGVVCEVIPSISRLIKIEINEKK